MFCDDIERPRARVSDLVLSFLNVSDDDRLLLDTVFDSKGQLKLYHPDVQDCLMEAIRKTLITKVKERKEKEKEECSCCA